MIERMQANNVTLYDNDNEKRTSYENANENKNSFALAIII